MVSLAIAILAAQVIALQKPAALGSSDAKERVEAIREIAKEPPSEVKGVWLFEALADPDTAVVSEAVAVWRTYQEGFCDQLQDAITEGNFDGKPVSEPAKSVEEWEKKLAKQLLAIARSSSPELSLDAIKTIGLLTTFGKGLDDAILLTVLRTGDPANLTNGFAVGLRTLAKENPQTILGLLKSDDPRAAMGAIMSLGEQMPPEADEVYLGYLEKRIPIWMKMGLAGFSYRPQEARRRYIVPYLRNANPDMRRAAADLCGYKDEDWKKVALDRGWPGFTRALAVEYRSGQGWTPEELARLQHDPDPLIQAAIAPYGFPGLDQTPPDYDLLWQRSRSQVPELRAACLRVLVRQTPEMRRRALELAFEDRSPLVRGTAARLAPSGQGFDAQRVQAYSEGLVPEWTKLPVNFDLFENKALLDDCLRSRNDRKALLAASALLLDRPALAVPILTRLARSTDEDVQDQAFSDLAYWAREGHFPSLSVLADPNNPRLFATAVRWMEDEVKEKAIPFLRRFVGHSNRKVRIAAKRRLAQFARADSGDGGGYSAHRLED